MIAALDTRMTALILLFGAATCLFLVNQQVPMFADDLCRAHHDFSLERAIGYAWGEYMGWSGRYPVMLINNMLFSGDGTGLIVLSLLNSAILVFLGWFIVVQLGRKSELANVCLLLAFAALTWFSARSFGEAVFWKTGSVQYFWGTVLAIVLVLPMAQLASGMCLRRPGVTSRTVFIFACLIGGAWLENMSVAVVAVGLMLLVYARFIAKTRMPRWIVAGFVAWILGTVVLLAAPGNYVRVEVVNRYEPVVSKVLGITSYLLLHMDPLIMLTMIGFLVIAVLSRPPEYQRNLLLAIILFGTGVIAAYATIGAPVMVFKGRLAFPTQVFFVLSALAIFPHQLFSEGLGRCQKISRTALMAITLIVAIYMLVDGRTIYREYRSIANQEAKRQEMIAEAVNNKLTTLKLPALYFNSKFHTRGREVNHGRRFARDITFDPNYFTNNCYAKYFGLKKVVL